MDTGMLLLRMVVGLLLVGHGAQHALGWFGGYGADGTGAWLQGFGFRHGRRFALLLGWSEIGAGALFATGLLVPLAAAGNVGVALGAAMTDHGGKGLWIWKGGAEYVLVLGVAAVAVALAGPGAVPRPCPRVDVVGDRMGRGLGRRRPVLRGGRAGLAPGHPGRGRRVRDRLSARGRAGQAVTSRRATSSSVPAAAIPA